MLKNLSASSVWVLILFVLISQFSCRDTKYSQGRSLYETNCQNCHLQDFKGLGKNIPGLTNSFKNNFNAELSMCIIHNGRMDDNAMLPMPSFKELSDVEFHNLINFLNEKVGSSQTYSLTDISKIRLKCTVE